MKVHFWGARGSIAVSGARFAQCGGNTSCVELTHAGERLILDGGTGLRALGDQFGFEPVRATVLFTHVHWDHIQGVPFFNPAYHPDSDLNFIGLGRAGSLRETLASQMRPPTFPVGIEKLVGIRSFVDARPDRTFEVGPFKVTPRAQDHPDGVVAFRIEAGGRTVVFATDVEHGQRLDPGLLRLAEGCDLLIHDAQYTDAEYQGLAGPSRKGWGHSTWRQAAQTARAAQVGQLALFHHDPRRDDAAVAEFEAAARSIYPQTIAAREGAAVSL